MVFSKDKYSKQFLAQINLYIEYLASLVRTTAAIPWVVSGHLLRVSSGWRSVAGQALLGAALLLPPVAGVLVLSPAVVQLADTICGVWYISWRGKASQGPGSRFLSNSVGKGC